MKSMIELKAGLKFSSYEELTNFIHMYEEESKQKLWKRSSRTLKSANLKKQCNEKIQYYEIHYSCIHGEQRLTTKNKGLRKFSTRRVDCPFNIKLRASADGQFLEIRSCNDQHENHSDYVKPDKNKTLKEGGKHSIKRLKQRTSKIENTSKHANQESSIGMVGVLSVDSVCRVCGNRNEQLLSIHEGESLDYQLQIKINRYLPFTVERTDTHLPSNCCYQCASILLIWHEFVETSIEADRRLKTQFVAVKLENLEESTQNDFGDDSSEIFEETKECTSDVNQQQRSHAIAFISFSSYHNAQKSLLFNQDKQATSTQPNESCVKSENHNFSDDDRGDLTASPPPPPSEERVRKKVYRCDTCQETFKRLKTFKMHLTETLHKTQSPPKIRPSSEPRYYCDVCDYGFGERQQMVQHRTKAHQTPDEIVKNEDSAAAESKSLAVEIKTEKSDAEADVSRTASSEDKELCNICNSLFAIKQDLKRHIRLRHPEITPMFSCDVCSREFLRKYQMQKHRKQSHSNIPEKETLKRGRTPQNSELLARCKIDYEGRPHYQCEHCPRIIHLPYEFLRHQTIHTGVRAFFCHLCGKSFGFSSGLSRHIRELHYGVKKYPCDICGRRFASKNTRDDHMNIHTGARPFVCDLCGKCFKQKASLNIHKTFHTNKKPHVCTTCGKQFRRAHELKVHGWVHTGFKPHACTMCDSTFRLTRGLKRHLKKRHGNNKDVQMANITKSSHIQKSRKKDASSSNVDADEGSGTTSDTNPIANEYFNSTRNFCGL